MSDAELPGLDLDLTRATMARRPTEVLQRVADNSRVSAAVRDAAQLELQRREAAEQARQRRGDAPLEALPEQERAEHASRVRQVPTEDLHEYTSSWTTSQASVDAAAEELSVRQAAGHTWASAAEADQITQRREWVAHRLPASSTFPRFGSPAWSALDDQDPRKWASVVAAAEASARESDPDVIADRLSVELAAERDQAEAERAEWRRTQDQVGPHIIKDAVNAAQARSFADREAERTELSQPRTGDYPGGPVPWEPTGQQGHDRQPPSGGPDRAGQTETVEPDLADEPTPAPHTAPTTPNEPTAPDAVEVGSERDPNQGSPWAAELVSRVSGGRLSRCRTDDGTERRNYVEAGVRGLYATELATADEPGQACLAQAGQLGGAVPLHRSTIYAITSHRRDTDTAAAEAGAADPVEEAHACAQALAARIAAADGTAGTPELGPTAPHQPARAAGQQQELSW